MFSMKRAVLAFVAFCAVALLAGASPYPLSPEVDCGAAADGVTDDYAALQSCLNTGKPVRLTDGKTYRVVINWVTTPNAGLVIPAGATLDTTTATVNLEIAGNAYGVRLQDGSRLIGHGAIKVTAVSYVDSLQSIMQSVVSLGTATNEMTDVSNLGPFLNAKGWLIDGVTLSTVKPNGYLISGIGGLSGTIRNVTFPSSASNVGCINFDWGTAGVMPSTFAAMKAAWLAGTFYTVHPSRILIENIEIGDMSHPLSQPIRFSGTDNITLRNWHIGGSRAGGVTYLGGDLGYEYAKTQATQLGAYLGSSIKDGRVDNPHAGYAVSIDTYADNIYRDPSYTPTLNPIYHTNIVVDNVSSEGDFSGTADGVTIQYSEGATVRGIDLLGFRNAVRIGDYASNVMIQRSRLYANVGPGVFIAGSFSAGYPKDIMITDNQIWANGSSSANLGSTNSQIYVGNGARPYIQHNVLGYSGEGGGYYGTYVDASVADGFIFSNYIAGIKSGGAGIAKGSTVNVGWNYFAPSVPPSRQIIN